MILPSMSATKRLHPALAARRFTGKATTVRYPMRKRRGLCLCSTATQTPGGAALVSSHDTSGATDKCPVLTHRGVPTCEQETLFPLRCFTLAARASLLYLSGTQLAAWAGNPRAVSPCGTCPVRRLWPVAQQGALAQGHCSRNVQERQDETCYARGNSSPCVNGGDSLPHQVEGEKNSTKLSRSYHEYDQLMRDFY